MRKPRPSKLPFLMAQPRAQEFLNPDGTVNADNLPPVGALPLIVQPDPTDYGPWIPSNLPLWGYYGPLLRQMIQRRVSNCYFETSVRGIAQMMGDHLYHLAQPTPAGMVRFYFSDKSIDTSTDIAQGDYGAYDALWGSLFEKVWAMERTGANTLASTNMGNPYEVWTKLGYLNTYRGTTVTGIFTPMLANWHSYIPQAVSSIPSPLSTSGVVGAHSYLVGGFSADGSTVTLLNPWGYYDCSGNETWFRANFNCLFWTTGRATPLPSLMLDTDEQRLYALMERIICFRNKIVHAGHALPPKIQVASNYPADNLQALEQIAQSYQNLARTL